MCPSPTQEWLETPACAAPCNPLKLQNFVEFLHCGISHELAGVGVTVCACWQSSSGHECPRECSCGLLALSQASQIFMAHATQLTVSLSVFQNYLYLSFINYLRDRERQRKFQAHKREKRHLKSEQAYTAWWPLHAVLQQQVLEMRKGSLYREPCLCCLRPNGAQVGHQQCL